MKLKQFNFKRVNSTNNVAIKIIKNSNCNFGMIIADTQKKGKGQYGKKWISYKGNLFVSIFFKFDRIKLSLNQMTKINCLLVKKLLSFYCKKKIKIKLPNDLLIDQKKISGILQEIYEKNNTTYMIIGIGINLIKNPTIKNYPTTNLSYFTKLKINRNKLATKLKNIYENFLPKLYNMDSKFTGKI